MVDHPFSRIEHPVAGGVFIIVRHTS